MMGNRKLKDIQRDLATALSKLPTENPGEWFDREIRIAADDPTRDVETLEMVKAELSRAAKKKPSKPRVRTTR